MHRNDRLQRTQTTQQLKSLHKVAAHVNRCWRLVASTCEVQTCSSQSRMIALARKASLRERDNKIPLSSSRIRSCWKSQNPTSWIQNWTVVCRDFHRWINHPIHLQRAEEVWGKGSLTSQVQDLSARAMWYPLGIQLAAIQALAAGWMILFCLGAETSQLQYLRSAA